MLDQVVSQRGVPQSITVDNGTEFSSKAMDLWAYKNGVHLDFIRPGRPVENGYIFRRTTIYDRCKACWIPVIDKGWIRGGDFPCFRPSRS